VPEEDVELVLDEARQSMQKAVDSLTRDLTRIRTGRANPAVLDGIQVDYHGVPTPLKALATINVPEPRLITVQPFDRNSITAIERAILKADVGLSPASDGKLLRVPIPELTEERRRDLTKQVKKMGEEHKVGVRNARRDSVAMLKDLQKDGDVDEDTAKQTQKKIQSFTDDFAAKIDEQVRAKEEEILTI
jgi:ribosome recycling factor